MKMKQDCCPICKSLDHSTVKFRSTFSGEKLKNLQFASRAMPQNLHHGFYECTNCKILFQTMTKSEISEMFEMNEHGEYDSKKEAMFASKTYINHLQALALPFTKKQYALDIGTGEGSFLEELLYFGFEKVCGVEPAEHPVQCANDRVKPYIKKAMFSKNLFQNEKFDLVSLFQAIEHVFDPLTVCKEVYSITENNGYFFLVFHNYKSIYNKVMGKKSPIIDLGHFQIFSKHGIKVLLKKAGFAEIQTFNIKNTYPLQYWFKILPMPGKLKAVILKFLTKSKIGNVNISISGSNGGAVARKIV